jgi:hypothetical protein
MANNKVNVAIELYDGWQGGKGIAWRRGVILQHRGSGDIAKLGQALEQSLKQVKSLMAQDDLLTYWYSYQVGGLMVVLSQDLDSGYKCVPRLQPRVTRPHDVTHLFVVCLGPEQGAYAIEGYQVAPTSQSHRVIQRYQPISWRQHAEKSA